MMDINTDILLEKLHTHTPSIWIGVWKKDGINEKPKSSLCVFMRLWIITEKRKWMSNIMRNSSGGGVGGDGVDGGSRTHTWIGIQVDVHSCSWIGWFFLSCLLLFIIRMWIKCLFFVVNFTPKLCFSFSSIRIFLFFRYLIYHFPILQLFTFFFILFLENSNAKFRTVIFLM